MFRKKNSFFKENVKSVDLSVFLLIYEVSLHFSEIENKCFTANIVLQEHAFQLIF